MCRYGEYGPYKEHYACFACPKMFRYMKPTTCPNCGLPLSEMGKDFCPPKKKVKKKWKVVEMLYQYGITFHSCGCGGPGYRPTKLREVSPFLHSYKQKNG